MKTIEIPKHRCPVCFYVSELMSGLYNEDATASAGDIHVCIKCGTISIIQKDFTFIQATEQDLKKIYEEDRNAFMQTIKASIAIKSRINLQ